MGKKNDRSASEAGGKAVEKAKKRRKIEPCVEMGGEKLECRPVEDEISLQLQEERRKALEILDSMVTGKACSTESARECEEGLAVCAEDQAKKTKAKRRVKKKNGGEIQDSLVESAVESNEGVMRCAEGQPKKNKIKKRVKEVKEADRTEGSLQDVDRAQKRTKRRKTTEVESRETKEEDEQVEKAYSVNTDLRKLFNNPTGEGFSFLGSEAEDSRVENEAQECRVENHEASPDPELQSKDNGESIAVVEENVPKYFFFHSGCDTVRNRMNENSFHRTESLEELQQEWPTKRTSMKQSFRRRHKDALKFGGKR